MTISSAPTTGNEPFYKVASFDEIADRVMRQWNGVFAPLYLGDTSRLFDSESSGEKIDWSSIEVGVNQYALAEAIGNAIVDLERWCKFHLKRAATGNGPALPDRHKYAGFVAKWIAKGKPIYIRDLNPESCVNIPQQLYRINALFALVVMQSYLEAEIPFTLFDELFYILHFREESGETLALLAYCGEELGLSATMSSS